MAQPTERDVAVVVLDWDGGTETLEALASAQVNDCQPQLILVDNASTNPVVTEAEKRFPGILVVENQINRGYAGGANVGLAAAAEAGCSYAVVLNNDAICEPGAIDRLLDVAQGDSAVAVVGAKILDAADPGQLLMAWGSVSWRQSLVRLAGEQVADSDAWRGTHEVEWVSGCAILLRLSALSEAGFFDEAFFAYHEEVELCVRLRKAGLRVVWTGEARIRHRGEGSSGRTYVSRKQYFSGRNMVRFVTRHGSVGQKFYFGSFFLLSLPFQWLRRLPSGEAAGVILKWQGARDQLLGRPLPRAALGLDHPPGAAR